jgi:hypothetical protein
MVFRPVEHGGEKQRERGYGSHMTESLEEAK